MSHPRRVVVMLDRALNWCVENWRAMAVLLPAGTFVIFALTIFFGLTVGEAVSFTRGLLLLEIVLAAAIIAMNLKYRRQLDRWLDAADAIEAKLGSEDAFSDWDDFIGAPADDPEVERIRLDCLRIPQVFPPVEPGAYCNARGIEILNGYVRQLRCGLASRLLRSCSAFRAARRAGKTPADADAPRAGTGSTNKKAA